VGPRRRSHDRTRIEEAAGADFREERRVLTNVREHTSEVAVISDRESAANYKTGVVLEWAPGKAKLGREVVAVRLKKLARRLDSSVDKALRTIDVIRHHVVGFGQRWEVLPTQAQVQGQVRTQLPLILYEPRVVGGTEVTKSIGDAASSGIY